MTHVVLSIGSNLGEREATLRAAVHDIAAIDGFDAIAASGVVETAAVKPYGVEDDAPAYLNAIVTGSTTLPALALLKRLQAIELSHGRVRAVRWGDRTLDIDIVVFGGEIIEEAGLSIPHPRAGDRAFVLAPWVELEPDAVLAGRGRIADLLAATGEHPAPIAAEPLL